MGNKPSDLETKNLLEALANPNSSRTSPITGLKGSLDNAEILRQALLNTFKNVERIHTASLKQTVPKKAAKKIVSLLKNEKRNSTTNNAQQLQESLAFMHRELTNLITTYDRFRIADGDKKFETQLNDIIAKGMKSMPKETLRSPLKEQMEGIKAVVEGCTTTLNRKQTPQR